MDNVQFEEHLKSVSDSDIAQQLAENIAQYKNVIMDPDATMSIPDLNRICIMADELSKRLAS